jgi:hypothetical protein
MKRRILFVAIVSLLPVVCLGRGGSLFPSAWYVPYDRLIANTEAFIRDHPNDPQGIVLKNGVVVPTDDWLVSPIPRNPGQDN